MRVPALGRQPSGSRVARRQTKFRPREYAATKSKVEPERQRRLITTGCPITAVVPMSANGTSVWTGRALQVGYDGLEIVGLAHLYSAL